MDSVNKTIENFFSQSYISRIPSHERNSDMGRRMVESSEICFVGGTNILSSNISPSGQWKLYNEDIEAFSKTDTVTIGVGWNAYGDSLEEGSREKLKEILSGKFQHSVRDRYTEKMLSRCGINSIFTGCPTTWSLNKRHCESIPTTKADSVVFTLTEWRKDPQRDKKFIKIIKSLYKNVYFFSQMYMDYEYLNSLGEENIKVVSPTLSGFDSFLNNEDVDFIGTRLHGGIRALQKGKRTLIISVDNRAVEMGRDMNLPVMDRSEVDMLLEEWCLSHQKTDIKIPSDNVSRFLCQFDLSLSCDAIMNIYSEK